MNSLADYDFLFWLGWDVERVADALGTRFDTADKRRRELGYERKPTQQERRVSEFDEQVRVLIENGATTKQVCKELAASQRRIERAKIRLRNANLLPPAKHTGLPMPEDRVRQVEAMLDDGASFNEVHRTIGVSLRWLERRYPGRAWTPSQSVQYRNMKKMLDKLDGRPRSPLNWT